MSFIFFLALKHIYAAASFPPVPVQHEYSHSPYRLQMCTHTHTHIHPYITPKCRPLDPWKHVWLENFRTAAKQMLEMILFKQHQKNLCGVGLVSSHWNNSELMYSEHLTQTSTLSHQIMNIQTLKRTSNHLLPNPSFYTQGDQAQVKGLAHNQMISWCLNIQSSCLSTMPHWDRYFALNR